MGETTALNSGRGPVYLEDERYEKSNKMSICTKVILSLFSTILAALVLYLLVFLLPGLFIPEATDLVDIPLISHLDVELTPVKGAKVAMGEFETIAINGHKSKSGKKKVNRLILVGDIHGQYDEFKQLLKKIKFNTKYDHLLVLGDFITKGPESLKVVDYLIDNDVDCILGNHEFEVLKNYANFHGLRSPDFGLISTKSDFNSDPDYLLAKKLQAKQVQYINRCSVIKTLGNMPIGEEEESEVSTTKSAPGIAVHAGIRWDLPLEEQNPLDNLEMRAYLEPFYNETTSDSSLPDAVSWSKIFNKKQEEQKHSDDQLVVYYGHDARHGLKLRKFTKGLDSGCNSGRKLTAMVIWNGEDRKGRTIYYEEPVQVDC